MRVLFVHPLVGNAFELYKAFSKISNVDVNCPFDSEYKYSKLLYRILFRLRIPMDTYGFNDYLLENDLSSYHALFIIKGNEIKKSTMAHVKEKYPNILLIHWSLDDVTGWHTKSLYLHQHLKLYDIVYTTKAYNIKKLSELANKPVKLTTQGYSNNLHKPDTSNECKTIYPAVLFIGRYEKERFASIEFLANNGIGVEIFGPRWPKKLVGINPNITIHETGLYGTDYAKYLTGSKICLGFLSKINRDQYTSRSLEIPACKGFLLAERTDEHLQLFQEGVEAEFFSTDIELLNKVNYYLNNEEQRKQIAESGYQRCIKSGYSYDDIAKSIIKDVENHER